MESYVDNEAMEKVMDKYGRPINISVQDLESLYEPRDFSKILKEVRMKFNTFSEK